MKCAGGDTDSAVTSESTCSRGPRSESAALFAPRRTTWWQRHRLPSVQNSQPSLIAHLCDGEAVRTAARGEESERESGVCELHTDLTNYLLSFRIRKKEKITYYSRMWQSTQNNCRVHGDRTTDHHCMVEGDGGGRWKERRNIYNCWIINKKTARLEGSSAQMVVMTVEIHHAGQAPTDHADEIDGHAGGTEHCNSTASASKNLFFIHRD